MIKQCTKCKKILSEKDFHKDWTKKDAMRPICKECASKIVKENKEKLQKKHNGLIDVYYDIKKRCYDKTSVSYKRYGARGITMCTQWENDRQAFFDWCITNGYKKGLQIDRIDNDKGYCPENCRFVTRAENQHNTSQTVLSEKAVKIIKGNSISKRYSQKELAKRFGVSQSRISEVVNNNSWKEIK